MAKKQTPQQIETSLSHWKTRLRRAVTMIDKLERQQKRLVKAAARPARGLPDEPAPEKPSPVSAPVPPAPVAQVERVEIDTAIPDFLRRGMAAQKAVDQVIADQLRETQAATKLAKSRGRIATMKAKKSGETRKMPLTGKAAPAVIRG